MAKIIGEPVTGLLCDAGRCLSVFVDGGIERGCFLLPELWWRSCSVTPSFTVKVGGMSSMTTPLVILMLLCSPLLLSHFAGKREVETSYRFASYGLGLAFLFFATGHFAVTEGMVEMLPPWLPSRHAIVYITGVFELMIAVGIFLTAYREAAGKLAIATLICFFSVNIYAAWHGVGLGGHQWGPGYLLIRAPLQLILIAWTYYFCVKHRRHQS